MIKNKTILSILKEQTEPNRHGFTDEEMKRVEDYARRSVEEQYEWLEKKVEELKPEITWAKERIKMKKDIDLPEDTIELLVTKYLEPKIKEYEKLKEDLENFDFDKRLKDAIEWDLGGGAYTMTYKIMDEKWREEALNRKLTEDDIIDLFVTALEGGSNYWYMMDLPKDIRSYGSTISEAVGNYILKGGTINFYDIEEYREVEDNYENGDYTIEGDIVDQKSFEEDLENTKLGYVDMDKILEAIIIIKRDYAHVWENILLENADAGDADLFLQICVMGEVVYG